MIRAITLSIALITWNSPADAAGELPLRVPPGFVIERAVAETDLVFPMFAVFDDRGRLFVTESSGLDLYAEISAGTRKCRIRIFEDHDGDGRFESSRVFADGLVFPMGLAWRDGRLYAADPPDLVALEDTDNNGRAERRKVILSGFGHRDNGSLHGLIFGPDGLLYMTTGHPDGYRFILPDGTRIEGESGALLRCRPDGSHLEIISRGFENLVEVAFTPSGEIIGTDNWFQRPTGGIRDALVHLVEGGLYPLNADLGTPQPITGEFLPPVALFPAVALSGLARYRGTRFPSEMRGNLFSAQHNARKVERHVLVPESATFRTEDFDFVTSDDPDFHPSDVLEAADGSLLVVDTGSWYVQHCPTGKIRKTHATGGLYRVRRADALPLDDPWGLRVEWQTLSDENLASLLSDKRPVVRDKAQRALEQRGVTAVDALKSFVATRVDVEAKQRAIWTLAAIPGERSLKQLRAALHDADSGVAATAARALGRREDKQAAVELSRLLAATEPQLRLAAAEALGHCGDARSLAAIWQALTGPVDRVYEHALIVAAHRVATTADLESALEHPSSHVQKAALILLDQPPRPKGQLAAKLVIERVSAADAELRQAALHVLRNHPEWSDEAVGLVRDWLASAMLSDEEQRTLSGLILAFQERPVVQDLVADALNARKAATPPERRALVLETMSRSTLRDLPKSWSDALAVALEDPSFAVRAAAVRTIAVLQVPHLDDQLAALVESRDAPAELRLEALRAILPRRSALSDAAFELLLRPLETGADAVARIESAELLGRARMTDSQRRRLLAAVRGDALVSPATLLPAFRTPISSEAASDLLDYLADSIRAGWRPTERDLAQLVAAVPAELRAKVNGLRQLMPKGDDQQARLMAVAPLLSGGEPERGRSIFFGKKVGCAACHRIGGQGGQIGPDLTKIGAIRSGRDLLESIALPSSTFAQGYENYLVQTTDGLVLGGLIARQSAETLVLLDASGNETRVRKDQIEEMRRQATSIMPEGLDRALTAEEMRDLLAFLLKQK